mgnify:CR=1 FL=1
MNIILGDAFQKDAGTTGTIDYEIRILLDNIDYTEDVVQEEYKRHADKSSPTDFSALNVLKKAVRKWKSMG